MNDNDVYKIYIFDIKTGYNYKCVNWDGVLQLARMKTKVKNDN